MEKFNPFRTAGSGGLPANSLPAVRNSSSSRAHGRRFFFRAVPREKRDAVQNGFQVELGVNFK